MRRPSRCWPRSGAGWRRPLARRIADHLSLGSRPGESASQGAVRLEPENAVRRHRHDPRRAGARSMGDSRQSSRWLGVRRHGSTGRPSRVDGRGEGDRPIAQGGLAAAAHLGVRELGRRGAGPAGLHRMGRNARRRTQGQGGAVHQLRHQRPRLSGRRRQPRPAALRQRSGARRERSRDRRQRAGAGAGEGTRRRL